LWETGNHGEAEELTGDRAAAVHPFVLDVFGTEQPIKRTRAAQFG
jgi:hypothetical protein